MATEILHGVEVRDPFRSLEDGNSPETKAWTAERNAETRATLDALPVRAELRRRLEELASTGRVSSPCRGGSRLFWLRREGKENQPSLWTAEGDFATGRRRILDVNARSADGATALDWFAPNHDGSLVAYGLSEGGSELSTLRVRRVADGLDLPDVIPRTRAASIAWLRDASGFYYTRYPAPGTVPAGEEQYHRRVYFHRLGDDPARDPLVFGADRAKEDWPGVSLSDDDRWLLVHVSRGWSRTDVYLKNRAVDGPWIPVLENVDALASGMIVRGTLFLMTNVQAPRYRIVAVDPNAPGASHWRTIVRESGAILAGFVAARGGLVVHEMIDACSRLRRVGFDGADFGTVGLPPHGSVAELSADSDGDDLLVTWQSFTEPPRIERHAMAGSRLETEETGARGEAIPVAQEWFRSKDGTRVPMFVIGRRGPGPQPALLTGYGGFNISRTPMYSSAVVSWIERGGLYAVANLRGGGEYGEAWHRAGMLGRKQNVFDDFFAAMEHLAATGATTRERLAIMGGSNGGLLVGAAITQRPELFRAAVCAVPVLDMLRYHKFLIARLWIPEYGSADDPDQFRYLHAYSPYHRVKDGTPYPAVLFATAEEDSRVDPMHARKMAARLKEATSSGRPVLLRVESRAGHGQGKPLGKALDELADELGFLANEVRLGN